MKIQREKYVHRLIIPSTKMSDAGQYTVVAGGNTSSANLIVEGRDIRIRSIRKDIQVQHTMKNKYFITIILTQSCKGGATTSNLKNLSEKEKKYL